MSQEPNGYLENQESAARVLRMREQLDKDPSAVLSQLRETVGRAEPQALAEGSFKLASELSEAMETLTARLAGAAAELPQGIGFFAGERERARSLQVVLHFLRHTQSSGSVIRCTMYSFSELQRSLCHVGAMQAEAAWAIHSIGQAAKGRAEAAFAVCAEEQLRLAAYEGRTKALRVFVGSLARITAALCGEVLPTLQERLNAAADLENEGKNASPQALFACFGETRYLCEKLHQELRAAIETATQEGQ